MVGGWDGRMVYGDGLKRGVNGAVRYDILMMMECLWVCNGRKIVEEYVFKTV